FAGARWTRPAPIDVRSSVGIAESVVLDRPDPTAPVSNLYLFGRREDLAFEQEVGKSAKERNHVRFWRSEEQIDGRPLWLGAATFDRGVGLSSLTGQITHHIAADVDTERDVGVLKQASEVAVTAPTVLPNPGAVAMKQHIWAWLRPWLDAVHRER